jgi:EAL domain-containing protein (putative c-di-GMP-specific phosphodiesterase class I)
VARYANRRFVCSARCLRSRSRTTCAALAALDLRVVPIGEFVLDQACAQLRNWRSPRTSHLTVAVNVSATQLAHGDFVRVVKECIDDFGVEPCRLELEIAESMLFHACSIVIKRLHELKRFGLRIVLDDFDCGYMSLSRLTTLPADGLKIDRSFARALPDDLKTVGPPAAHLR